MTFVEVPGRDLPVPYNIDGWTDEKVGEWYRDVEPDDPAGAALVEAIVDSCSMLPTSLLLQVHEFVLTAGKAATGDAVQDLETDVDWDRVDSFDDLMEIVDERADRLP